MMSLADDFAVSPPSAADPDVGPVGAALTARFAERLGIDRDVIRAAGPESLEGLTAVYSAWCRGVNFDNARKRIFLAESAHGDVRGDVPGHSATAFIEEFLAGGTGGTCWATSAGLVALLRSLGFHASIKPAIMMTDPETRPNHASVVVELGPGRHYVVDTAILHEVPVAIPAVGEVSATGDALHPIVIRRPQAEYCELDWVPAHARDVVVTTRIYRTDVLGSDFRRWHDATRTHSLFNQALYARRNRDDGIDAYGRGRLIRVDATGTASSTRPDPATIPGMLMSVFGFSADVVARLPTDETGPAFL